MTRKLFFGLFIIWVNLSFAQNFTLSGKVIDENGDPLPFANIYLENTSIGTYSDINGEYQISLETEGTYQIICSIIGFIPESSIIRVSESNSQSIKNFNLKPDIKALETVVVDAKRDKQWKRNYQRFAKSFLGTDEYNFHTKCTIDNSYVLEFESAAGNLTATTNEPLVIKNTALGYTIIYDLSSFSLNKLTGAVTYTGYAFFEEMNPPSVEKAKAWEENRKRSYLGSKMHFLRALSSNQIDEEGFELYNERVPFEKLSAIRSSTDRKVKSETIAQRKDDATSFLSFPGFIRVEYRNKQKEIHYENYRHLINETSWMQLRMQNTPLDHQGFLIRPMDVWFYEEMGLEGISRQLPTNYNPGDEITIVDTKKVFTENLNVYDSLYQREYVFLDFDENAELVPGGSVDFDAYLFSGKFFELGSKSRVLYVELIGPECELVSKAKIDITGGKSSGSLSIPATLYSGIYEFRAFTQWMKNFDSEGFFSRKQYLSSKPRQLEANTVKFYPEYGSIITGAKNTFQVRTFNEIDQPVTSYIRVFNSKHDLILDFSTDSLGFHEMVDFKPKDESYYALIDGSKRKWELPISNSQVLDLSIDEIPTGYNVQLTNLGSYSEFTLTVESYELISSLGRTVIDRKDQFTFFVEKDKLRHGINDFCVLDEKYDVIKQKRVFHRAKSPEGYSPEFLALNESIQDYFLGDAQLYPVQNEVRKPLNYSDIFNTRFGRPEFSYEQGFSLSGRLDPPPKKNEEQTTIQLLIKSNPAQVVLADVATDGSFHFDDVLFNDTTDLILNYGGKKASEFQVELDTTKYFFDPTSTDRCSKKSSNVEFISSDFSDISGIEGAIKLNTVEITSKRVTEETEEKSEVYYGEPNFAFDLDKNESERDLMIAGILEYLLGRVPGSRVERDLNGLPQGFIMGGIISFQSGSSAMFLFDGIQISARDFNLIDPDAIGKIEVFDGPSAAIFGARGAAGVVVAYSRKGGSTRVEAKVKTFNLPGGFDVVELEGGN